MLELLECARSDIPVAVPETRMPVPLQFIPNYPLDEWRYDVRQNAHIGAWWSAAILAACALEARDPIAMDNPG